jgi:predicted nucleotidyltransferase
MNGLSSDLREFVKLLVENEVEFIIVGGVVLAFHGVVRYTAGIDFFVRADADNAQKIEQALKQFGFSSLGLTAADFEDPELIVQLGNEPNRIDLITRIDGVSFAEAWRSRISNLLDGVPVAFLSRSALIANKLAAGREKDLLDVKELRKRAE